ncbi:MAG: 4Fe-4S binding protein [Lentisphaeria bacterium]|jgi:NosR/NirI family nitrous oxide reductase transcriptional regulator
MIVFAQMRFPRPEFENYVEPTLNLEAQVGDGIYLRLAVLAILLLFTGLAAYRWRSRRVLLLLSLLSLLLLGFVFRACPCPVGMYQNVLAGCFADYPLTLGVLLLFVLPLVVALYYGRLFCMGGCPLGALQELLHFKTLRVPLWLDRIGRQLALVLLLVGGVMAASGGAFYLCHSDPYVVIFNFGVSWPHLTIAGLVILLGVFVCRPYCRYICPYGVLLRICALAAPRKIAITSGDCISCRLCEQSCPNGAIVAPEPLKAAESPEQGRRRLGWLLALTPYVIILCAWAGYSLAEPLSAVHKDVKLLRSLDANRRTNATLAFASSGRSLSKLRDNVAQLRRRLRIGLTVATAVAGLAMMLELMALSRRRSPGRSYEVDAGLCVACGRCYDVCPVENMAVKFRKARPPAASSDGCVKSDH